MPDYSINVIPIRPDVAESDKDRQVVELAFDLWRSSLFRRLPEKALLTAVQMLQANTLAGLFLVAKRKSDSNMLTPMEHHSKGGRQ